MVVVSNSTALIYLAKGQLLEVLRKLYGQILIPDRVYAEVVVVGVQRGYAEAAVVKRATEEGWLVARTIATELMLWLKNKPQAVVELVSKWLKPLSQTDIDVLVLALETGAAYLILDDRAAIKAAKEIAIYAQFTVIGTGDVLDEAMASSIISPQDRQRLLTLLGGAVAWVS